jgi:small subunit ribosomal protein S5
MNNKRGRGPREAKEYEEEVIQIDRVTRVVKGGRRLRFRATVAVGNHKGRVGIGIGKSTEVQGAIQKAIAQAKKGFIQVPMVGLTIPHRIKVKYKSAKLLLMPACPGTGIIAGGPLRKILELSGVQDVLSKSLGCNNRLTNSHAAILALSSLREIPWLKKVAPVVQPTATPHAANQVAEKPKADTGAKEHSANTAKAAAPSAEKPNTVPVESKSEEAKQ